MTDDDLKELERLAEAAVRGPWEHRRSENAVFLGVAGSIWSTSGVFLGEVTGRFVDVADFIAASRTAVPALIAALPLSAAAPINREATSRCVADRKD